MKALSPELSITIPDEGGWVRKSVKDRTYKLTRYIVAEMTHASGATTVKLRASVQDQGTGHDIHYGEAGLPVSVVSVAKGVEQESYSIRKRDVAALVSLREELAAALNRLSRSGPRLRSAKIDDTPIEERTPSRRSWSRDWWRRSGRLAQNNTSFYASVLRHNRPQNGVCANKL